jgi:hypothetical protein
MKEVGGGPLTCDVGISPSFTLSPVDLLLPLSRGKFVLANKFAGRKNPLWY